MAFLYAFLVGGAICAIAQILIDKTQLTPARIVVLYVVLGVVLTAVGVYDPIVEFAGAGATVPIIGFGYALAKGVSLAIDQMGILGAFSGGFTASASGIAAVLVFGYLFAIIFKPKDK